MVGGALLRRLARENVELLTSNACELDCAIRPREQMVRRQAAAGGISGGGKVRGIVANNTLRANPLRQPCDSRQLIQPAHVNGTEKCFLARPASIRNSQQPFAKIPC